MRLTSLSLEVFQWLPSLHLLNSLYSHCGLCQGSELCHGQPNELHIWLWQQWHWQLDGYIGFGGWVAFGGTGVLAGLLGRIQLAPMVLVVAFSNRPG
jgi:hypothetical protein